MFKILVEFINIWLFCDEYGVFIKKMLEKYVDKLEIKLY